MSELYDQIDYDEILIVKKIVVGVVYFMSCELYFGGCDLFHVTSYILVGVVYFTSHELYFGGRGLFHVT